MVSAQGLKYIIFIIIVFIVVAGIFLLLSALSTSWQLIIAAAVVIGIILMLWKFEFIIFLKDYERAVIFRFGKVNRVGGPGWALLLPGIESYTKITLRVQTIDVPKQDVITKGSIELGVDGIIYLHVRKDHESCINSVIAVEDYKHAVKLYVIAQIRDIMGSMPLSEIISNIDTLNRRLKEATQEISTNWGIEIDAVEIKDVDVPKTLLDAMHRQKAAVQEKLARLEHAEAHKVEIAAVKEEAEGLSDKALSYYYIKALEEMAKGKGTKIYFPIELSRLAETLSGKLSGTEKEKKETIEKLLEPYKNTIAQFVDSAVKESKQKKKKTEN